MTRGGVDITGERLRGVEWGLLTSPWKGADWRRVEESVGIEVDIRLILAGFTLEGSVSPSSTVWGVTVVVLLTSLMSDALEIVLDFGMLGGPATDERRGTREGVSDWVEDRFKDIVGSGQTAVTDTPLWGDPGERNTS
jgi:hypothetical protein